MPTGKHKTGGRGRRVARVSRISAKFNRRKAYSNRRHPFARTRTMTRRAH